MNASACDRFGRLDKAVRRRSDAGEVAGTVAMLAQRGKVIYCAAHGYADLASSRLMREDAIFRLFSNTKPVTSLAVLMLMEAGAFGLCDPIAAFIPELAQLEVLSDPADAGSPRVPLARPITILDLLTHTSGLGYGLDRLTPVEALYDDAQILRHDEASADKIVRIAGLPLHHQPGLRYTYSVATDVLGRLVEVVAGVSLDRFFEERIFKPIGMRDTAYYVPPEKLERLATLYTPLNGKLVDVGTVPELAPAVMRGAWVDKSVRPAFLSGGAGLVSTAADYLRFGLLLANWGDLDGVRLITPETVALMTRAHLRPEQFFMPGCSFGLGFTVLVDPVVARAPGSPGTYAASGAAQTFFWVDPGADLVGVLMLQLAAYEPSPVVAEFIMLAQQATLD